jgi:mannose-6-phosphate isomerase
MCVEGSATFSYQNQTEILAIGETILIPASIKKLEIFAENQSELLEVYIK